MKRNRRSRLTLNRAADEMPSVWYAARASLNSAKVRTERTPDGREFLVAPITLIVPGVLNGSKGPLFYPPEEIAASADYWNGMPLVLNHPVIGGRNVSGRTPAVMSKYGLGTVYNVRADGNGRLRGEGWFDVAATKRIAPGIHEKLTKGEPFEVSTGLHTDDEPVPARNRAAAKDHRGRSYTHVARNYRPDHLAVLSDQRGACSVRDGCGGNVDAGATKNAKKPSSNLDMTDEKACKILHDGEVNGNPLTDAQRGMFGAKCGKDGHTKNADGTCDTCVINSTAEGSPMKLTDVNRKKAVKYLTTNCECWKDSADVLNEMEDDVLVNVLGMAREDAKKSLVVNAVRERFEIGEDVALNAYPAEIKKKADAEDALDSGADDDEENPDGTKKVKNGKTKNAAGKPAKASKVENVRELPLDERLTEDEIEALSHAKRITSNAKAQVTARLKEIAKAPTTNAARRKLIADKLAANPKLDALNELLIAVDDGSDARRREPEVRNRIIDKDDLDAQLDEIIPRYEGTEGGGGTRNRGADDATGEEFLMLIPTVNWGGKAKAETNGKAK